MDQLDREVIESLSEPAKRVFGSLDYRSRQRMLKKAKAFDVASFILLPDGSVYQCNYNLKSCQVSVSKTDYTEVQINQMKEKQLQEEQQKLEQDGFIIRQ